MASITSRTRGWYHVGAELLRRKSAQTRADRKLAVQIASVFEQALAPSDIESVSFYVREGNVTVFGTACRPQSRVFITELLQRIPGIRNVNDHLQMVAYEEVY